MGSARRAAALVGALACPFAFAAPSQAAQPSAKERAIARSVTYHAGKLFVRDAMIALPHGYRYLAARDAQRVLTDLYGNPPHPEVRALIFPPKSSVLFNPYFVVVTYENDGHVSDKDARGIDYDKLLRRMQDDAAADNARLAKQGYEPVLVLGWADTPHYDAATHNLYWAQDLRFGSETRHTLNYDVRTLGREGMLSLHAVASLQHLREVRASSASPPSSARSASGCSAAHGGRCRRTRITDLSRARSAPTPGLSDGIGLGCVQYRHPPERPR